jgi:histidine triad (HIT) family protein
MVKDEKDCLFCKVKKGELPTNLIYYDDKCFVILDIFPSQKGHMLVISKDHHKNLLVTPDSINSHDFKIAKKFAKKAKDKLKATGIKLVVNVGRDAGQFVEHTHIHIVPHYHPVFKYTTDPNPKITEKDAKMLLKLLSEVSNVRAFQCHNLDT